MKSGKRHYPGYIPEGLILLALTWIIAAMLQPVAAHAAHHKNKNLATCLYIVCIVLIVIGIAGGISDHLHNPPPGRRK